MVIEMPSAFKASIKILFQNPILQLKTIPGIPLKQSWTSWKGLEMVIEIPSAFKAFIKILIQNPIIQLKTIPDWSKAEPLESDSKWWLKFRRLRNLALFIDGSFGTFNDFFGPTFEGFFELKEFNYRQFNFRRLFLLPHFRRLLRADQKLGGFSMKLNEFSSNRDSTTSYHD